MYKSTDRDSVEWRKGSHPITSLKSSLGLTLSPIYEQVEPITFIAWNDDAPLDSKQQPLFRKANKIDSFTTGISKGVIAYTKRGGFLVSHSIPRYPPSPTFDSHYEYPESGKRFAQMAICVTSEKHNSNDAVASEIGALLDMMIHFKPQVYASNILEHWPLGLRDKFEKVIHPTNQQLGIPFIGYKLYGKSLISIHAFGRSNAHGFRDTFKAMAEYYKTPLVAQTLLDRDNPLPSSCDSKYSVENVERRKIWTFYGIEWIEWSRTNDHSKWIAAKSVANPVVCVSDLDRIRSVMQNGGMFICIEDVEFFQTFSERVTYKLEGCDVKRN